jgi:hypothetical protein
MRKQELVASDFRDAEDAILVHQEVIKSTILNQAGYTVYSQESQIAVLAN